MLNRIVLTTPCMLFSCLSLLLVVFHSTCLCAEDAANLQGDTVRLGLLVPDRGELAQQAIDAAMLAVEEENRTSPNHFVLMTESCEGPWGIASKASVRLLHELGAAAMIGSLDGRNAHLAEQVAVKSRKIILCTRAGDPSLSYAFVPWFFRCTPDDVKQAAVLLEHIQSEMPGALVGLVGVDVYDSRMAMQAFAKSAEEKEDLHTRIFMVGTSEGNPDKTAMEILDTEPDVLVFFDAIPAEALLEKALQKEIVSYAHQNVLRQLGTRIYADDVFEDLTVVAPASLFNEEGRGFQDAFVGKYGYAPGATAAYAYDGAKLLMQTISTVGTETETAVQYLRSMVFNGITGNFSFDRYGNRASDLILMQVKQGKPVIKRLQHRTTD